MKIINLKHKIVKLFNSESKKPSHLRKLMPRGKGGQMLIVGVMIMVMTLILFIALLPAIKSTMDTARGCDSLNCQGFVDMDASSTDACSSSNRTYTTTLDSDSLSCTVLDLGIPYLILGVLAALIFKLLAGQLVDPVREREQSYGYGGYPG